MQVVAWKLELRWLIGLVDRVHLTYQFSRKIRGYMLRSSCLKQLAQSFVPERSDHFNLAQTLEDARGAHAAADAHCNHSVASITAL